MATARKLPSGQYRCLIYDKMVDGKRKYKSFTAPTKKEAEYKAAMYLSEKETSKKSNLTFEESLKRYIGTRESVLSAGTIREYKRSQKADFKQINDTLIYDITQDMIQDIINEKSKKCAPKTVRNLHGLISAVMKEYRPSFVLNTSLPQKIIPELYIPTDKEVKTLLSKCSDKDMRIAIMLAAFGPLRRSEICGLESSDIKNGIAHIKRAIVMNYNHEWVTKTTKSVAGNRYIPLPDFVLAEISNKKGRIVDLHPNNITDRFIDLLNASGLHYFRFHDLRHYCASILHANGIPDAYILQRGGWSSDAVMKQIYRHALSDRVESENIKANEYFSSIYATQNATQTKKVP